MSRHCSLRNRSRHSGSGKAERGRGGGGAGPSREQYQPGADLAHAPRAGRARTERQRRAEHALMEVVGLSTHADDGGGGGRTLRFRLRARLWGLLWEYNPEGERAVTETAGSSCDSSVALAGVGWGGMDEFQGPGPSKC